MENLITRELQVTPLVYPTDIANMTPIYRAQGTSMAHNPPRRHLRAPWSQSNLWAQQLPHTHSASHLWLQHSNTSSVAHTAQAAHLLLRWLRISTPRRWNSRHDRLEAPRKPTCRRQRSARDRSSFGISHSGTLQRIPGLLFLQGDELDQDDAAG